MTNDGLKIHQKSKKPGIFLVSSFYHGITPDHAYSSLYT